MFAPFYHELLRKYHVAFGSVFKNITILRRETPDGESEELQRIVVPIEYSARDAWLTRLRTDPDLANRKSVVLPRFGYEMTGLRYDAARKLNSLNQRLSPRRDLSPNTMRRYFTGTPYILTFNLYALTDAIEEANQIVEQIVPIFTPDYSLMLRLLPSLGILDRMRIVLDGSPQWTDNYETAGFEGSSGYREIILTFSFNVSATFYGPVAAVDPKIIRHIMVDLYEIPNDVIIEEPAYIITDALERFKLENSTGRLLNESSQIDLRDFARQVRIDIKPNPLNAAPIKPVNVTTTITNYTDIKQADPFSGTDVEIGG